MVPILRSPQTMRGLVGVLAIGLTTAVTAGCGSISSTSDGGAGSGGAGATGGHAGSGGARADGGAGTGGSGQTDGGNRDGSTTNPVCPKVEPAGGTACPNNGLTCEYGTDPRGDLCRDQATCSSGHWTVSVPDPAGCPSIGVTTCQGTSGSTCSGDGTYCTQSNGVDCECTSCPPTAPVCIVGTAPTLACRTNTTSGCPAAEPNLGTSCGMEGLICSYCPDVSRVCMAGLWTKGSPCPVVN